MLSVRTKIYSAPDFDTKEILRYMGAHGDDAELSAAVSECIAEAADKLTYKVCYATVPIKALPVEVDFGFTRTSSLALSSALSDCRTAILFAATVGIGIDRLIARSAVGSQLRELAFSAIGAERIEALCECFCHDMRVELSGAGLGIKPRFSPGYADLPLEFQRDVFAALDCAKHIGLTLNDSLLMSPSKSVTAIVGVYKM